MRDSGDGEAGGCPLQAETLDIHDNITMGFQVGLDNITMSFQVGLDSITVSFQVGLGMRQLTEV